MDLLQIGMAWAIYLLLHSLLASKTSKLWVSKHLLIIHRFYRFLYSTISTLGLLLILYWMVILPSVYLWETPGFLRYLALILATWGVILVVVAFRHISGVAFVGLMKQPEKKLIKTGIHAHLRHPIYSGIILILVGMVLYTPSSVIIVSSLTILAYLPLGIYYEERKLVEEFGEEYLEYKQKTGSIFPKWPS